MRKNFCQFLLDTLPFLQEYGNISYQTDQQSGSADGRGRRGGGGAGAGAAAGGEDVAEVGGRILDELTRKYEKRGKRYAGQKHDHLKPVVPIISIETPD